MNRPIKFRAWDGKRMRRVYSVNSSGSCIVHVKGTKRQTLAKPWLMQFTGLLDKNGKEIYEGDVVWLPIWNNFGSIGPERGLVSWRASAAQFVAENPREPHYFTDMIASDDCIEVIGNRFENPELLKV